MMAPLPKAVGSSSRLRTTLSGSAINGPVAAMDFSVVLAIGVGHYLERSYASEPIGAYVSTSIIYAALIIIGLHLSGNYCLERLTRPLAQIGEVIICCLAMMLVMIVFGVGLGLSDRFATGWTVLFFTTAPLGVCGVRIATNQLLVFLARRGRIIQTITIVGGTEHTERLIAMLHQRTAEPWTKIVGFFDDRISRMPLKLGECPYLGTVDDLIFFARTHRVDDVLITLPWHAERRLLDIVQKLKVLPANIQLVPNSIGHDLANCVIARLHGVPVLTIYGNPISGWCWIIKFLEDRILGALLLLLLAPVMLACAVAIKLDSSGPILFRQRRYGYNNSLIEVFKFRTMYHEKRDENAETLTTRGDTRITRIGKFLRRTSLDELPQLFNVVLGDMSLVGPRPHAIRAKAAGRLYQDIVNEYAVRHKVKPGITGWAQVNGWRGETDTEEKIRRRVEHDLYYMDNLSLLFDLQIMVRTLIAVLLGRNAY